MERKPQDVKQGLGRKWRGDEGPMWSGASWHGGCWERAENYGQVASNAQPGQLTWRPLGLGPGLMSVDVNVAPGKCFLEAAWDSGWGTGYGTRTGKV